MLTKTCRFYTHQSTAFIAVSKFGSRSFQGQHLYSVSSKETADFLRLSGLKNLTTEQVE